MRSTRSFVVRWADCDANGHMRNTAYSEYAIDTRMAYLTEHGFPYPRFEEMAFGPVILREEIDYLREVRLGESVAVDFTQLGLSPDGGRWRVAHDFWKSDGERCARIVITGGWLGMETRRLIVPPEPLLGAMSGMPRAEGWQELPPLRRSEGGGGAPA